MSRRKVIDFDSKGHLIEKAGLYIESIERFLEEKDTAIPILVRYEKRNLRLEGDTC